MVTCPRCGNPAILMASEEFQLLDCEFCDDVIDVSDLELPELEPEPGLNGVGSKAKNIPTMRGVLASLASNRRSRHRDGF